MRTKDVVIVGAGQAGLVTSRALSKLGVDHVVFERGCVGERWISERWRSLHLLTTNAMSALPGGERAGADPDGFMHASAFASYLSRYAEAIAAPVTSGVEVTSVTSLGDRKRVLTNVGEWRCRAIVVATGACDTPYRPAMSWRLAPSIFQIDARDYRGPEQLPASGVLVVGASASGLQIAEEIRASGRPVTLSIGSHTRLPRRYRGKDIFHRMEQAGLLDERALESGNLESARRQPSPQLVGRADQRDIHIGLLRDLGARLVGRLTAIEGAKFAFADDLARTTRDSHERLSRTLDRIDEAIERSGRVEDAADPSAREPVLAEGPAVVLDLARENIGCVVWATGYRRRYPWLEAEALDARGEIRQHGGLGVTPGLFTMGLTFMRRRRSHFIDGCGLDAAELAPAIKRYLDGAAARAA